VAKRLTKHVRQDDIVARYGGDEFVILITPLYDSDIVKVVRDKIERSLTQPFDVSGNKVNIGVSLGTAIYPDETTDINELLNRADERMYMDKKSKGW
jgi:diguanylate cyclase (GGDEF)-like protein